MKLCIMEQTLLRKKIFAQCRMYIFEVSKQNILEKSKKYWCEQKFYPKQDSTVIWLKLVHWEECPVMLKFLFEEVYERKTMVECFCIEMSIWIFN